MTELQSKPHSNAIAGGWLALGIVLAALLGHGLLEKPYCVGLLNDDACYVLRAFAIAGGESLLSVRAGPGSGCGFRRGLASVAGTADLLRRGRAVGVPDFGFRFNDWLGPRPGKCELPLFLPVTVRIPAAKKEGPWGIALGLLCVSVACRGWYLWWQRERGFAPWFPLALTVALFLWPYFNLRYWYALLPIWILGVMFATPERVRGKALAALSAVAGLARQPFC